jgi:hypothetical protein
MAGNLLLSFDNVKNVVKPQSWRHSERPAGDFAHPGQGFDKLSDLGKAANSPSARRPVQSAMDEGR